MGDFDLREKTRERINGNFNSDKTIPPSHVQSGALLRIADALEKMAGRPLTLPFGATFEGVKERMDRIEDRFKALNATNLHNQRRIASLKGVITRMKRRP